MKEHCGWHEGRSNIPTAMGAMESANEQIQHSMGSSVEHLRCTAHKMRTTSPFVRFMQKRLHESPAAHAQNKIDLQHSVKGKKPLAIPAPFPHPNRQPQSFFLQIRSSQN